MILGGVLVIVVTLAVVLAPTLPGIAVRLAGFQPVVPDSVLSNTDNIPVLVDPVASPDLSFWLAEHGAVSMPSDIALNVQSGIDESGAATLQVIANAQQIHALCQRLTDFCGASGSPVRNGEIEITNAQLLVSGEAFIDFLNSWQSAQLVVDFDENASLIVENIVLGGVRYAVPNNSLGNLIRDMQETINQGLHGLSARQAGNSYRLAAIDIAADQLVATFR